MYFDFVETPIGIMRIECTDDVVCSMEFLFGTPESSPNPNHLTDDVVFQLSQYFKGRLQTFDLPLYHSGTEFQNQVWRELENIPYGHILTYGQLATKLGDPNKVRAVGAANGKNCLAIVVPCHRVIGASGQLVGYAGGLHRKQWLLQFEKQNISQQTSLF